MTTSKSIAGLIGPTYVAGAVAVLVNLSAWPALVEQGSAEVFGSQPNSSRPFLIVRQ
jgi:hypothetical protein